MLQCVLFIKYHVHQIKENEMGRACGTNKKDETYMNIMIRKSEGERPIGRPGPRWEDNINLAIKEKRLRSCGLVS
jgi:hypothetical protein